MTKTALITGITGQDGGYLAELLLGKGYVVHGMLRATSVVEGTHLDNLCREHPEKGERVHLHLADLTDSSSLATLLDKSTPNEIYHLAGQSHVEVSFDLPEYTGETTAMGALRILEAIRRKGAHIRFYQASTSEIFGQPEESPQNEHTPFRPVNPYAAAKLYAHTLVCAYRRAYGLHACNGILFNHESPFRGRNYVTRKIAHTVALIADGRASELVLGNLEARRDWGYAGDYVEAMHLMLQTDAPDDFVIATGESHSVREFCEVAFAHVGLDYTCYVRQDPTLFRPTDISETRGDASKARRRLGWKPRIPFASLVRLMVDAEMDRLRQKRHP